MGGELNDNPRPSNPPPSPRRLPNQFAWTPWQGSPFLATRRNNGKGICFHLTCKSYTSFKALLYLRIVFKVSANFSVESLMVNLNVCPRNCKVKSVYGTTSLRGNITDMKQSRVEMKSLTTARYLFYVFNNHSY